MPRVSRQGNIRRTDPARAAHAGNEFHFRFAARRALRLLNPLTGLSFLRVENGEIATQAGTEFLAIDVSEYYGGADIQTASRVVGIQLKYSTANPKSAWTVARLSERGRGASVIKRLVESYLDYVDCSSRDIVVKKLRLQLVSNQPVGKGVRDMLDCAQTILSSVGDKSVKSSVVARALSTRMRRDFNRLKNATQLKSGAYCDFLRVLDLSKCGEASLDEQKRLLFKEASPMLGDSPTGAIAELLDAVKSRALPDKANDPGLREEDILAIWGTTKHDLLPCPSKLELPEFPIETNDVSRLATAIVGAERRSVIANGVRGVGKSTTAQLLEQKLPTGSAVVIYDCFGQGESRSLGKERYVAERAFLQIHNEIAIKIGAPPLIGNLSDARDRENRLTRMIDDASRHVRDGGGLLVLVIDAADDAIQAANDLNRDSFVERLSRLALPEGFRLVLTARTGNLHQLSSFDCSAQQELIGFSSENSTQHLKSAIPIASDDECKQFHKVTQGNPRLQWYKIESAKKSSPPDINIAIDPSLKALESLFDAYLKESFDDLGGDDATRNLLNCFVVMTKPTSFSDLADATGFSVELCTRFLKGLEPGTVVRDGEATIRDKDFADFLRAQLSNAEVSNAHGEISTRYLSKSSVSESAAVAIADHLAGSGRWDDLSRVGLDGWGLSSIGDPIARASISRRRIGLAIDACSRNGDAASATKLLLNASMSLKEDYALSEVVRAEPGLAAHFGEPESIRNILLRPENQSWLGGAHFKIAALFARVGKRADALDHLRQGDAWLRLYFAREKKRRHDWNLEHENISDGAEAHYWLFGVKAAHDYIFGWSPESFVVRVSESLVSSLLDQVPPGQLVDSLEQIEKPGWFDLILVAELWKRGYVADKMLLHSATRAVLRRSLPERNDIQGGDWPVVDLCECRSRAGLGRTSTLRMLRSKVPKLKTDLFRHPVFFSDNEVPLRALSLEAVLTSVRLDPEIAFSIASKDSKQNVDANSFERRQFMSAMTVLLPAFEDRARVICGVRSPGSLKRIRARIREMRRDRPDEYGSSFAMSRLWSSISVDFLLRRRTTERQLIQDVVEELDYVQGTVAVDQLIKVSTALSRHGLTNLAVRCIELAIGAIDGERMPASERREILLYAAHSAVPADEGLARECFDRAIQSAQGVDSDNMYVLDCLARTCRQATCRDLPDERRIGIALRLASMLDLHSPYKDEKDFFPDYQVIEAVAAMWPSGALGIVAKWDDDDLVSIDRSIGNLSIGLVYSKYLDPLAATSLLQIASEGIDPTIDGVHLIEQASRKSEVDANEVADRLVRSVLLDLPQERRRYALERVIDSHATSGLPTSHWSNQAIKALQFLRSSKNNDSPTSGDYEARRRSSGRRMVSDSRRVRLQSLSRFVQRVCESDCDQKQLREIAGNLILMIPYADRLKFVKSIVESDVESYYSVRLGELLCAVFDELEGRSKIVSSQAPSLIDSFLKKRGARLAYFEESAWELLDGLISRRGESFGLESVSNSMVHGIESVGIRTLCAYSYAVWRNLPEAEWYEVFDWLAVEIDRQLGESSSGYKASDFDLGDDWSESVAAFLWRLFGHVDRRTRWRAVHAAHSLVADGYTEFIDPLMSRVSSQQAKPRATDGTEFFSMSARTWLFVLIQRLADEFPDVMSPHMTDIYSVATSSEFPHIQIRELARQSVFALHRKGEKLTNDQVEELSLANRPKCCVFPRKFVFEPGSSRDRGESRFHFDAMDTLPYWYEPANRVFGYPSRGVVERADRWITDVWKRISDDLRYDRVRKKYRQNYSDYRNDHGTIPPIEIVQNYLELHAMLLSMGELVDEGLPVVVDEYENPDDPWAYFMRGHLPLEESSWLSDRRSLTPLIPELWNRFPEVSAWRERRTELDYRLAIGLEKSTWRNVVVDASIGISSRDRYGRTHVCSAMVDDPLALSLAASLIGRDRRALDSLMEEDCFDGPKQCGEFVVEPITTNTVFHEFLDQQDARCGRGIWTQVALAQDVVRTCKLQRHDRDGSYLNASGDRVVRHEWWYDLEKHYNSEESGSEGSRFWISRKTLTEYLTARNKSLIITVTISRNVLRRYSSAQEEGEYDPGVTRSFIIKKNGKVTFI